MNKPCMSMSHHFDTLAVHSRPLEQHVLEHACTVVSNLMILLWSSWGLHCDSTAVHCRPAEQYQVPNLMVLLCTAD